MHSILDISYFTLLNFLFLYINLFFIFYSKNPIYSVVFLMATFLSSSLFLLYLGIEFFAMLILVIYVGAISILFLFVIMLIDIKEVLLKKRNVISLNFIIFIILFMIFIIFSNFSFFFDNLYFLEFKNWFDIYFYKSDIINLGFILYNFYFYDFITIGFILLIAMIGCIALVLEENFVAKKQQLFEQIISKGSLILND